MLKKLLLMTAFFLIMTNLLLSCTAATVQQQIQGAHLPFRLISKAKVTDKTTGESHNIDLIITVDPGHAVRMDVTALLGYRLAELVMTPLMIQYIQREDKIFVKGDFKSKTLKPLFKQEIDPKLIWSIAHEQTIKDGKYYGSDVHFELLEKDSDGYQSRKVTIENQIFKMVWAFKSKEIIELDQASYNETFVLSKPDEYKLINIK